MTNKQLILLSRAVVFETLPALRMEAVRARELNAWPENVECITMDETRLYAVKSVSSKLEKDNV